MQLIRASRCVILPLLASILLFLLASSLHARTVYNNKRYLTLKEVAKSLHMKLHWIQFGEKAELKSRWTKIEFDKKNPRFFVLNNYKIWVGDKIISDQGNLFISEKDYKGTLLSILAPQNSHRVPSLRHIVIDPGHGGKDTGAINSTYNIYEKDMALDVALRLEKILKSQGYKVTLTRRTDVNVPLGARPELADRLNADLFVSIHFNSVASSTNQPHGVESFVMPLEAQPPSSRYEVKPFDQKPYPGNLNDTWNALLGYNVHKEVVKALNPEERGLKRARLRVLRLANCPAVLIEGGFMSNPDEMLKIKNPRYRTKLARAICQGILNYDKKIKSLKKG